MMPFKGQGCQIWSNGISTNSHVFTIITFGASTQIEQHQLFYTKLKRKILCKNILIIKSSMC